MVFMRRHASKLSPKLHHNGSKLHHSGSAYALGNLNRDQLVLLTKALMKQSMESIGAAYKGWKLPWAEAISELELLRVVREVLDLSLLDFDDDAVHILWSSLDREGKGQIEAAALLSLGPDL